MMNSLSKNLVTLTAALVMALPACGGEGGGGSTPGGQGGAAGGGQGGTSGGSSSQGPSCESLCATLASCGVSGGECQESCSSMSGACRSCLSSHGCDPSPCDATCQGGGGSGGGENTGGEGGGATESDLGKDCTVGGFSSECAQGESCKSNKGGLAGICTIQCTNWNDCPSFWDCTQVGPGKFCFPQ